jgi:chromate transporter
MARDDSDAERVTARTGDDGQRRGEDSRARPSLARLWWTFLLIGSSAVGMGVMQAIRSVPVRRSWMTREEVDEGLGLVQLYPGAIMVDLVAYIGYRMRGVRGAFVSALGFVGPSLALVLGLSWAYFAYRSHPIVARLAVGVDALVVGVLVNLTLEFGADHARGVLPALVALAAFGLEVAGQNALWAVLGALVVGAVAMRPTPPATRASSGSMPSSAPLPLDTGGEQETAAPKLAAGAPEAPRPQHQDRLSARRLALSGMPGLVVALGAAVAAISPGALAAVSADMAKIGAVAFGNGTAIMPLLQQAAVGHRWLTLAQFGVGVGFGQVTPGPFLSTATFVGYGAAGVVGGLAAGLAIYAPSVAMTMVAAELYPVLRRLSWVRGAIAAVMAAFTGLLAGITLVLGRPVLPVPAAVGLSAAAFVAVRALRWNMFLVFGLGLGAWAAYLALGGAG